MSNGGDFLNFKSNMPRMLVIAEGAQWVERLGELLLSFGKAARMFAATSWETGKHFCQEAPAVIFVTPECLPEPGSCKWPQVLLLDSRPAELPPEVCDWLAVDSLNAEVLRRCLQFVQECMRMPCESGNDALTGIANRQSFQALLASRLQMRSAASLVLGYLDLDNFKQVNDSLGQQAGDRLIRQVVARLRAALGHEVTLGRIGSDEFGILLEIRGMPAGWLDLQAVRMLEVLAEPYWIDGESLLLGCSLGLVQDLGAVGADLMLWHAHMAMEQAKVQPGCTYRIYDETVFSSARSRTDQEVDLRRALRRDEMELYYQPRIHLASGDVVGLEALVRWRHPERGLLLPQDFIPLAEQSGLIVPLGYWVIARALRDASWLHACGMQTLHMAINLSFRQFQDSQLLPTLQHMISGATVDPRWLEFELTETAVMSRSDYVLQTMNTLRDIGARFALDDFGTGFSSFSHLSSMPVTLLKIDKSFVMGVIENHEQRQMLKAIINLGHSLGLEVIAEGVEQQQELDILREFECDQAQGYLLSRALPLADVANFLLDHESHRAA